MTVAVMQPYLFPYLGYYQLAAAADGFVFFDDAQYITRGYVNRNRLRAGDQATWFTVPVAKHSSRLPICEVPLAEDRYREWRAKFLARLRHGYGKTPHYAAVRALVERVCPETPPDSIAELCVASVTGVFAYVGLELPHTRSSALDYDRTAGAAAKVRQLARGCGATRYLNPPGGRELYAREEFTAAGLELCFLEPALDPYDQGGQSFLAGLSILDALFYLPPDQLRERFAAAVIECV